MVLDIIILRKLAIKYDFFLIGLHFIDSIVNHFKFEILHRDTLFGFDMKHTFVVEQERKTTGRSQRSSGFIEITAHIGDSTGRVIGSCFYDDSDTERTVSFINHLLIIASIFRRSFFNSPFYIFFRHIRRFGILHQYTQTRIGIGIGATGFNGNRNFFPNFRKCTGHIAPPFQFSGFTIFKSSSHRISLLIFY